MNTYDDSKLGDFETEEDVDSGSSRQLQADDFVDEDGPESAATDSARRYSVRELVRTLGGYNTDNLSPELERRVLDFRLAQTKRRERYGEQKRWGIFGLYAHLANLRIDLEWAEDAAWRRQNHKPYLSWSDFNAARLSGRNRPYFTYFLIAFCSIMLLVEFGVNGWKVEPISVNPMIGPSAETLIKLGARDTLKIVDQGQWYRIFTPLVLHAGIIHYFINMVALWFVGGAIEQSHGIFDTAFLFSLPGVGGNILGAIFLPQYISVGASGGIFGLMGGCIADMLMNWHLLFLKNSPDEPDQNMYRRNFWAVTFLFGEISINIVCGFALAHFIFNDSFIVVFSLLIVR
jgi:membrane associated rhomboid family serine protease